MYLLVLNCGSSSLRFKLFDQKSLEAVYIGHVDGIGLSTCTYREKIPQIDRQNNLPWKKSTSTKTVLQKSRSQTTLISCQNHTQALKIGLEMLKKSGTIDSLKKIKAVGHRVVHGGEFFKNPVKINQQVKKTIKNLIELAPLHNPANLEGIIAAEKSLPGIPNVAVFDTAFHQTIEEKAFLYALPFQWYKKYGIRRYGFHGTSHKYVSREAIKYLRAHKKPHQKIITCHLGNGVSITAIKNGRSIDTSMGFTPLEGVPMGTRSGDFDPAIIEYMHHRLSLSVEKIDDIVNHQSGLKGLSGISSDVRPLRDAWFKKHDKAAKRAFDIYCYRIAKYISSYQATLGGLDAIVFTAGIGEHAWYVRVWICQYLSFTGLKLDADKNQTDSLQISTAKSPITVLVIATNEEKQIAMETQAILKKSS